MCPLKDDLKNKSSPSWLGWVGLKSELDEPFLPWVIQSDIFLVEHHWNLLGLIIGRGNTGKRRIEIEGSTLVEETRENGVYLFWRWRRYKIEETIFHQRRTLLETKGEESGADVPCNKGVNWLLDFKKYFFKLNFC
jgi:hypothetical protein